MTDKQDITDSELLSAAHDKSAVAKTSVLAAMCLTALKIIVGIATGSLGILAEAAHSALDLIAALITWVAVCAGARPADKEHPYGHGKIENLSALFETLLLLVTCAWIIYEACARLFGGGEHHVDVNIWAFIVMIISIIVDIRRSRMLYAAAHKHNSQALEADALHFSTDIWSSAVVILGLVLVVLSRHYPQLKVLNHADSVAALVVAFIVISVSIRLGMRTIAALIDESPEGAEAELTAIVETFDGVLDCHSVRVRTSGPKMFIDAHITMNGDLHLSTAHKMMDEIEEAIQKRYPRADITIHPEPAQHE